MNHEYTDAAVEQRESHEDESQDWDLLFVGLACRFSFAVFFSFDFKSKRKENGRQKRFRWKMAVLGWCWPETSITKQKSEERCSPRPARAAQ